jgi:hypothetical protein
VSAAHGCFSFHPYPNEATDSLERGYAWPNAGFVNLDRLKQALWDAFHGTAQPTTAEGLRLHLDEVGWQVDTSGRPGYQGLENVPVTDEVTQAAIYGELIRRSACDPDVAEVSFFGFRDDGLRTGFQAALQRADGSARPAATAVQLRSRDADGCAGPEVFNPARGRRRGGSRASSAGNRRIAVGEMLARRCVRAVQSLARAPLLPAAVIKGRAHAHRRSGPAGRGPVDVAVELKQSRTELVERSSFAGVAQPFLTSNMCRYSANTCSVGSSSCPRARCLGCSARQGRPASLPHGSAGETLGDLCESYGGDPREGVWKLQDRNELSGTTIVPGQRLLVP